MEEHVTSGSVPCTSSTHSSSNFTQLSSVDLPNRPPVYIRRTDISASMQAYEKVLNACKTYTTAMMTMSQASAELANALEDCTKIKGAHAHGPAFQAASGLHYLKSSYEQVLCDSFWKEFSIPLLSHLDLYRTTVQERQILHERSVAEKSRLLKDIETKYQREGRKKRRDLSSFRTMLQELQEKVNELDGIKAQHYTDALEYEEQTWDFVCSKVALLVRLQVEILDRLSSKAVSDPVLDSITNAIPDPFCSYGPPKRDDQLFSILQPSHAATVARDGVEAWTSASPQPSENEQLNVGSTTAPVAMETGHESHVRGSLFPATASADLANDFSARTGNLAKAKSYRSLFGYNDSNTSGENAADARTKDECESTR